MLASSLCFAGGYYVCLGSYALYENAVQFQDKMSPYRIDSFIEKSVTSSGNKTYRVILRIPSGSFSEAKQILNGFSESSFCKENPINDLWILYRDKENQKILLPNKDLPVNEEKPYSLYIQTYKDEEIAQNDSIRLQNEDIDAYVVKKFDEKENFKFDLHAGAASDEKYLEEEERRLNNLKINYEVSNFNDFIDEIKIYNTLVEGNDVIFDDGVHEIPKDLSTNIKQMILQFPINKDFQIESVVIADLEKLYKKGMSDEIDQILTQDLRFFFERANAFSRAKYTDTLLNKKTSIRIGIYEEGIPDDILQSISTYKKDGFIRKQIFSLQQGKLESYLYKENSNYVLLGNSSNNKVIISMISEDFTEEEFEKFLGNSVNDSSLLLYPEIRKSLCIMPESENNSFLFYDMHKIGMDYVKKKNMTEWAWKIYGHWCSNFYFNNKNQKLTVGIFNLDYDYNATDTHDIFMKNKTKSGTSKLNHSQLVKNKAGWYSELWNKELSFSNKSYIVTIETPSDSILSETDFLNIADSLKIW